MDMNGRVALVTGANRGIGYALCEALGGLGATVLMVCRNEQAGAEAQERLREQGADATLYIADMSSVDDIEALGEEVAAEFDRLDVLVNCAAVLLRGQDTSIEDIQLPVLETTLAINFLGPVWMCKTFLPLLRRSDSGRIINFTSGLGRLSVDISGDYPAYTLTKTAVNGLTHVLDAELANTDLIVVSVDPGWVRTEMGGPGARISVEEGIDTPLWLATADPEELESGKLYCGRRIVSW